MKQELQDFLISKYKKFFDDDVSIYNENNVEELFKQEETILPIQFGFEVGDGWFMLLDTLMGEIENHISNTERNMNGQIKNNFLKKIAIKLRFDMPPFLTKIFKPLTNFLYKNLPKYENYKVVFKITQIKEKYAGLRFYYYGGDEEIEGMVSLAESLSYNICEMCGTTKDVGCTEGWLITTCKECYDKSLYNKGLIWKPLKTL